MQQFAPDCWCHALDRVVVPLSEHPDKVFDQKRDILRPIGQSRQHDRYDFQPVVKILAKSPFFNRFFQVSIRRRENADVDLDHFVRANSRNFSVSSTT